MRTFTLEEATACLPRLRPLLVDLREAFHEHKFALDQWKELVAFGEGEDEEARRWRREADEEGQRVQAIVDEIVAVGADVKDPLLGLVDFPALRSDGSIVLLCYRDDEDAIRFWHPLESGFAGRRPVSEL